MTRAKEAVLMVVCVSTVFVAFGVFGVGDEAGVHTEPGLQEDVRKDAEDLKEVEADREAGSEFTGGIVASISKALGAFGILFGLSDSVGTVGFDPRLGLLVGTPIAFIVGFASLSYIRGRGA